jgi:hypothetical protein
VERLETGSGNNKHEHQTPSFRHIIVGEHVSLFPHKVLFIKGGKYVYNFHTDVFVVYDEFSVTRLYSIDDTVTSEW